MYYILKQDHTIYGKKGRELSSYLYNSMPEQHKELFELQQEVPEVHTNTFRQAFSVENGLGTQNLNF